jgi:hypothetical protein
VSVPQRRGGRHVSGFPRTEVTPQVAVEAEHAQPHQARDEQQRQRAQRQLDLGPRRAPIEAQQQRQRLRRGGGQQLDADRPDMVVPAEPCERAVERGGLDRAARTRCAARGRGRSRTWRAPGRRA